MKNNNSDLGCFWIIIFTSFLYLICIFISQLIDFQLLLLFVSESNPLLVIANPPPAKIK